MTRPSLGSWVRPRILGAASALLLLAACSASTEELLSTTVAPIAATTTVATGAAPTTAATTATRPPDPSLVLENALAGYADGYQFTATTTVNGQVASVQTGRWMSGTSQMTVVSGDGEVEYIVTEAGQWARLPGGEWEELDGVPPVDFPLAGLASPVSIELIEATDGLVRVAAGYPAAALGLVGDPVSTTLVFDNGVLTSVSYGAEIDGNTAESITTLSAIIDTTPVTAPGS